MNAIPKSFLLGDDYSNPADDPEFYARSMVVNVPYGESGSDFLMFTNTINSMSKIKWQIQESKLVGRVSFERITGTDGQGPTPVADPQRDPSKPLAQNEGIVVYQFPITSQFDIRRDYNSQTGEEANVIVENTTDRPWHLRDYVRVDFSRNEVTSAYDFDTLSLLGVYNGIDYAPMQFDIRNPNDENAPTFDLDQGYFDVTNKLFANPKMIDVWGMHFPGCLLPNIIGGGTQPVGNCNPNELTIRHSFKRVVDTDYEPTHWDGQRQETYGAFQTERQGYNRDGGIRDDLWKRHISRYNIWERSHKYTDPQAMTGATACKVDAECAGIGVVPGMSHCDVYNAKCSLPYTERVAKPIVWHYADKNHQDYYDVTREATEEWDTAMRVAVNSARYAECTRYAVDPDCAAKYPVTTGYFAEEEDAVFLVKEINACKRGDIKGRDPKTCDALAQELADLRGYSPTVVSIAQMKPMVIMCHGPVSDKDPVECGAPGTVARLGDLRYHLVTNVATPQTNSPWGIMSDSNDPLTGMHVAASINVWTHVNDLFSRGIIDALRFINGELTTEQVTDGKYIDMYQEAAKQMKGGALTPMMSGADIDKRIAAVAGTTPAKMVAAQERISGKYGAASRNDVQLKNALVQQLKRVSKTKAALDAPSVNAPMYQARMNMAKGTKAEAEISTIAMQQLAQSSFGQVALDQNTKVAATSILQGLSPTAIRGMTQKREMNLAARGACIMPFEATAPLGYVGLGDVMQQKFGKFNPQDPPAVQAERAAKMQKWLAGRAHFSVMSHEMGHSFALRHNFVSSSDAWSFRPQYWQLRTNDKKLSQTPCKADGTSDGKECVGPRWLDPVSANESKNLIQMWTASSSMEYAGEPTQDLLGLGSYDFGAARFFYGDVTTVYDESKFKNTEAAGVIAQGHQNDFGGLLGYRYGDFSAPIHYSGLDGEVGLIKDCKPVDVNAFKPVNWDVAVNGEWNNVVDGHIVTNESGTHTRCKQPKVDFVQWDALKSTEDQTHAADAKGRVRVPQGFASDEWADLGNIEVFRHDNGADLFERMHFWIAQQEINHIFSNYRRGRRDFSVYGAFQRTLGRYHEKMRDSAKAIGLYVTLARDTVTLYNDGKDPEGFVAAILKQIAVENTVSSSIAFDHFAHVFSRPQPGEHATVGQGDTVLRSLDASGRAGGFAEAGRVALSVANGVTGGFGTISLAGRPIENALDNTQGRDYNRDYTLNVGSYYEKAFTAYLMTESADNFISASRDDFVDPRFRSVSIADVFPDGFRRWLGNNLTNDETIKGVYVRGTGAGPGPGPADLDPNGYALLGQTSWWPKDGIETCFPSGEKLTCRDPFATTPVGGATGVGPVVDPQIGWEQQRFALFFSLIFLPENGRTNWTDQIRIYDLSEDADPGFDNRIEFHNPDGRSYVAQTFGTEVLFGKTVQKGIGARVLEYANELNAKAVVTAPVMRGGLQVGIKPVLSATGNVQYLEGGVAKPSCENSKDCMKMKNYTNMPRLIHDASGWFGRTRFDGLKGVY